MTQTPSAPIDLIKELRLRRWARAHYVPPEDRKTLWHPVVLDEMQRRDAELAQAANKPAPNGYVYVPLAPQPPQRRDLPHQPVRAPNGTTVPDRTDVEAGTW